MANFSFKSLILTAFIFGLLSCANDGKRLHIAGVSTASRNAYGKTLTADEAAAYSSKAAVLGW